MDVRTSILRSGRELLEAHGIAALTQLRVAKAAGIKQSHLTYYFPKRSDLLLGIAAHAIEAVMSDLAVRLESAPPRTAIADTVGAAMIGGVPPRLIIGLIVAADEEPTLRAPLRKLIRSVRRRIEAMLERMGIADSRNAALQLHAAVVGLAIMHQAQQSATSAREVRSGIDGILRLLGAAPSPNGKRDAR